MALPNSNISTTLVGTTLGSGSRDVGTLCTHPNINKWSKWKPVPNTEVSFTNRDANNVSGRPNWQGVSQVKTLNTSPSIIGVQSCGVWIPQLNFYATWTSLKFGMDTVNSLYNWNKSFTAEDANGYPKRLGDFRGYGHSSIPFWQWSNENDNKIIGVSEFNFGNLMTNVETPWEGLDYGDFPAINDLNGGSPYLNCALFRDNATIPSFVLSSNDFIGGIPAFPYTPTIGWTAGVYKCYWFFSNTPAGVGTIPSKVIPLYSTAEAPNPYYYTLEDTISLVLSNFRYTFGLGGMLINYQLLDGTEYYGPYGIHSNFNNTITGSGFIVALDIFNGNDGAVTIKGSDVSVTFDNFQDVVVQSTTLLGLYENNSIGATNLLTTGVVIAKNATKTIYLMVGVSLSEVSSGKQFDLSLTDLMIVGNVADITGTSIQSKYRTTGTKTFYNLSNGTDFTSY